MTFWVDSLCIYSMKSQKTRPLLYAKFHIFIYLLFWPENVELKTIRDKIFVKTIHGHTQRNENISTLFVQWNWIEFLANRLISWIVYTNFMYTYWTLNDTILRFINCFSRKTKLVYIQKVFEFYYENVFCAFPFNLRSV